MPLEDLIELGYEVSRPPEDAVPMMPTVWGHGRQWNVMPEVDEEEIVNLAKNHYAIWTKMEDALEYFSANYKNWGSMTTQQKDAANRQAQRGLANLIRHVRNDLTSEGD